MASLSTGIPISITSWSPSLHQKSQISTISKRSNKHCLSLPRRLSCKGNINNDHNLNPTPNPKIDRRNVLLGLGSLGSVAGLRADPFTFAAPIGPPDFSQCGPAETSPSGPTINCCPGVSTQIVDFQFPTPGKVRVRPPAHAVDKAYFAKFNRAVELMKALPDDDPRSFCQQANIHCAYCDGAYQQIGFPDLEIQVHSSWLFFPFHRWYLYFFERILGKLIDDPDFTMPFWNWDEPAGMKIPAIYTDEESALYDKFRNKNHQPPTLVDLNYDGYERCISKETQIRYNLRTMYNHLVSSRSPELFLGKPYHNGDAPNPGPGSLELKPHNTVHTWTGDNTQPNDENMGAFYAAGRDPIFYAHHSNVDRMWNIWRTLGERRKDFSDSDWLDSAFLFYDENAQLVRVTVRDCLDTTKLGYTYPEVVLPWRNSRPTPKSVVKPPFEGIEVASFPLTLDKPVKTLVSRPKKSRSKKEKEQADEVLVIEGIEFDRNVRIKFDVFVNDEDFTTTGPDNSEFAGSFVSVPHRHKSTTKMNTTLSLDLTDLLEDLNAEGDEKLLVTLVPRIGTGLVSINGGIKIEFIS